MEDVFRMQREASAAGLREALKEESAGYWGGVAPSARDSETRWNGLPTPAMRGTAVVAASPEFPQYWARDIVGERIPVVMVVLDGVNYGGGTDYLVNRDASAWRKVTNGGTPNLGHRSVAIEENSFVPDEIAPGVVEDSRLPGDTVLYGSPEQNLAALDESAIEVKYTPNRAQRRAAQQAARRSVRRGQRAADRQVKELEDGMTPEEIERARRLAAKVLRDRRG